MQITDTFRVEVPVEQAWNVLLDVERIAPCMPGASPTISRRAAASPNGGTGPQ